MLLGSPLLVVLLLGHPNPCLMCQGIYGRRHTPHSSFHPLHTASSLSPHPYITLAPLHTSHPPLPLSFLFSLPPLYSTPLPNTHLAALASSDQQSVGQCTCLQCPVQSGPENLPWTHPHHTAEHKEMYIASHMLKIAHTMALTWSRYFTVSTLPYSTASCKQDPLAPGSFRFTSKPCLTSSPMTSLWLCLAASNRALCGMSER